jgi:hypothetical protein
MNVRPLLLFLCLVYGLSVLRAQPFYEFETLAGSRDQTTGNDGPKGVGTFRHPVCIATDAQGNAYVGDNSYYDSGWVRKVTPDGTLSTLSPDMGQIRGIAVDGNGTVYVSLATCIRKRTTAGEWVTVAGLLGTPGYKDGPASESRISYAGGLVIARDGTLYFMDMPSGEVLRRLSPDGLVSTLAGSPIWSEAGLWHQDGQGSEARFSAEDPIGFDTQGRLMIAGVDNLVRYVTSDGLVSSQRLVRSAPEMADPQPPLLYGRSTLVGCADGGLLWLHDSLFATVDPTGIYTLRAGRLFIINSISEEGLLTDAGAGGGFCFGSARYKLAEIPASARQSDWSLYALSEYGVILRGRKTSQTAPPILLTYGPKSQFIGINRSHTLKVQAVGESPLSYQWLHNGIAITGATQASLSFSSLTEADSGNYSVRLSAGGSLQADIETLFVWAPPVLDLSLRHETPGGQMLWDLAGGEGRLVAVGSGGCILTSADGNNWTHAESGSTAWLVGICRSPLGFVAVGDLGTILLSADGQVWRSARSSGTNERLNRVAYSKGLYVAVGEHGTILSSTDAENWTPRHSGGGWLHGLGPRLPSTEQFRALDGILVQPEWICAGQGGRVLASDDGLTWHDLHGDTVDIECLITDNYSNCFTAFGADGTIAKAGCSYIPGVHPGVESRFPIFSVSTQRTGLPVRFRGAARGAGTTFVLGEQGTVISYNSSYQSYAVLPSHTTATLLGGAYLGNSMYILGENETILRSSPYEASRLSNLSSLGQTGTGENTLVSGLSISGSQQKQLLVRGAGPALQPFGVWNWADRPTLSVFDSAGAMIATQEALAQAANRDQLINTSLALGAFPFPRDALDSALLTQASPGTYSFHLSSTGSQGAALLEIYDADPLTAEPRLGNLSTRGRVDASHPDLTAGLVINGQATRRILVRAIGPELKAFGIQNPIPDPVVRVYINGSWQLHSLGAWEAEANPLEAMDAASAVGAFALSSGSADAAAVIELPPGSCTFRASSASGKEGVVLIEIYDLP